MWERWGRLLTRHEGKVSPLFLQLVVVPWRSFGNYAKSTFSAFTTVDGIKLRLTMEVSSVHWVACGTCYTKTEGIAAFQLIFFKWGITKTI